MRFPFLDMHIALVHTDSTGLDHHLFQQGIELDGPEKRNTDLYRLFSHLHLF